jgi:hypothetical protein
MLKNIPCATDERTMRNLSFLSLLLVSCSTLKPTTGFHRDVASMRQESSLSFELQVARPLIFANGADMVELTVQIKNAAGEMVAYDPAHLKLWFDSNVSLGKESVQNGVYRVAVQPPVKSGDIKVVAILKDQISQIFTIKTTLSPLGDLIKFRGSSPSNMSHVNGLEYIRSDYIPKGQYEGFSISNSGKNDIVNAEESMRTFDFNSEEQVSQNIHMMVNDSPNGTVSHTMHSHFMFFPRTYMPFGEVRDDKSVRVTLPTGETMDFSKNGEVTGGVFTEGPVDTGPDRFKRTYANLKYQGKGIILRANARGQMPQQGQFEATKIDMEYGLKYSTDVLIINGTTGQRCRRPKADFWLSADVSPILFKFPTDKEFDVYLKAKCGFGIPELKIKVQTLASVDVQDQVDEVWSRCEEKSDVEACLDGELELIEDVNIRGKIKFETSLKYLKEKIEEEKVISDVLQKEVASIRAVLLTDASWVGEGCLKKSQGLVKSTLKFHDINEEIEGALRENCATIKPEMLRIAASEVSPIKAKLMGDFGWAKVASKDVFIAACTEKAMSLVDSTLRYSAAPEVYKTALKTECTAIEASASYRAWIQTQGAGLEEKILAQVLMEIEAKGDQKAQSCLSEFPMDNQLNRIRFKRQRESCLVDAWEVIEAAAIKLAAQDPLVEQVGLPMENISSKAALERRRLQLKLIKKYFV